MLSEEEYKEKRLKWFFIENFKDVKKDFPEVDFDLEYSNLILVDRPYGCITRAIIDYVDYGMFLLPSPEIKIIDMCINKDLTHTNYIRDIFAHELAEYIVLKESLISRLLNHYKSNFIIKPLADLYVHHQTDKIAKSRGYKTTEQIRKRLEKSIFINEGLKQIGSRWSDMAYELFEVPYPCDDDYGEYLKIKEKGKKVEG